MSADLHTPTNAGPEGSFGTAAGAAGVDAAPHDRPEVQLGAAFVGGLLIAIILKRLAS